MQLAATSTPVRLQLQLQALGTASHELARLTMLGDTSSGWMMATSPRFDARRAVTAARSVADAAAAVTLLASLLRAEGPVESHLSQQLGYIARSAAQLRTNEGVFARLAAGSLPARDAWMVGAGAADAGVAASRADVALRALAQAFPSR